MVSEYTQVLYKFSDDFKWCNVQFKPNRKGKSKVIQVYNRVSVKFWAEPHSWMMFLQNTSWMIDHGAEVSVQEEQISTWMHPIMKFSSVQTPNVMFHVFVVKLISFETET